MSATRRWSSESSICRLSLAAAGLSSRNEHSTGDTTRQRSLDGGSPRTDPCPEPPDLPLPVFASQRIGFPSPADTLPINDEPGRVSRPPQIILPAIPLLPTSPFSSVSDYGDFDPLFSVPGSLPADVLRVSSLDVFPPHPTLPPDPLRLTGCKRSRTRSLSPHPLPADYLCSHKRRRCTHEIRHEEVVHLNLPPGAYSQRVPQSQLPYPPPPSQPPLDIPLRTMVPPGPVIRSVPLFAEPSELQITSSDNSLREGGEILFGALRVCDNRWVVARRSSPFSLLLRYSVRRDFKLVSCFSEVFLGRVGQIRQPSFVKEEEEEEGELQMLEDRKNWCGRVLVPMDVPATLARGDEFRTDVLQFDSIMNPVLQNAGELDFDPVTWESRPRETGPVRLPLSIASIGERAKGFKQFAIHELCVKIRLAFARSIDSHRRVVSRRLIRSSMRLKLGIPETKKNARVRWQVLETRPTDRPMPLVMVEDSRSDTGF